MKSNKTLIEIKQSLYDFFLQNNSFDLHEDSKIYNDISDDFELSKSLLERALDELVESKILFKVKTEKITVWTLIKPLNYFEQSLELSFATALSISKSLNSFYEQNKIESFCDASNIKEEDVKNLALIVDTALSQLRENIDKSQKKTK